MFKLYGCASSGRTFKVRLILAQLTQGAVPF